MKREIKLGWTDEVVKLPQTSSTNKIGVVTFIIIKRAKLFGVTLSIRYWLYPCIPKIFRKYSENTENIHW